jgi:hypothetical protein
LKITITANLKVVDFLDVTFDLTMGTYKPYSKPNDQHLYVNTKSNHPPNIPKNIPEAVNERLSNISSNEEVFKNAAKEYQGPLNEAGYKYELNFKPTTNNKNKNRKRKRKMIYFNPPYSLGVSTRIGAKFLKILDKCFAKPNPLYKIFNRDTVKVSYRTTPNMKQIVTGHNTYILNKNKHMQEQINTKTCSCPKAKKNTCILGGKCILEGIVYQATVKESESNKTETYIGLTADPFKARYNNHTKSFRHRTYINDSELAKYIWKLKDENRSYTISWKIIDRGKPFNPTSKICQLCTREKYYLIYRPELCTLNSNSELGSHCRHKKKLLHSS